MSEVKYYFPLLNIIKYSFNVYLPPNINKNQKIVKYDCSQNIFTQFSMILIPLIQLPENVLTYLYQTCLLSFYILGFDKKI